MQFRPDISPALKEMEARIFRLGVRGLAAIIAGKAHPIGPQRLNQFLTKQV